MASLTMVFGGASSSVFAATAAKSKQEKGPFDWILGGMQKEDQLLETDPVLQKVGEKSSGGGGKIAAEVPPKKKSGGGGFGGLGDLFSKKD